jgi:hypothetical protein
MDSRLEEILLRMSNIIKNIIDRVTTLEGMAHAPRKFVSCEECKRKIREIDNGTN